MKSGVFDAATELHFWSADLVDFDNQREINLNEALFPESEYTINA